jgi:hypothetical protein
VISAATLTELGEKLDARLTELAPHIGGVRLDARFADNLAAAVKRFNDFAASGVDLDFHRGETPIERSWAGLCTPREGAVNSMHPLSDSGSYHCIILGAGALDTKGGPVVDERGRVMGVDGSPIPGLYGAGNCIASPTGHGYWGPGGTIGPATLFGYIAGCDAAGRPARSE